MVTVSAALRTRPDPATVKAVEEARAALLQSVPAADVGEHLAHQVEGERVVTHHFACPRPGYRGWRWAVTVTRAYRQRGVTVDEVVLVPGDEAIVAPPWVPYKDRIQPGDLSAGDVLPVDDEDPRLVPTYTFGDDPLDPDDQAQVRQVAAELYLGRPRTLSREGRDLAAERWYAGEQGPAGALVAAAPAPCSTCGFLMRMAGPLAEMFGVCANAQANDDGRVVSLDHGCGAHSEARLAKKHLPPPPPDPFWDTLSDGELEEF